LGGILESGNPWWFQFLGFGFGVYYASQKKPSRKRYHSELARRFREDLILDGKEPRSVQSYLAAVAQLAEHFRCSPDRLSEEQIRQYLLLRSQSLKPNSMRPVLAGLQFFYRVTIPRDWKTLAAARIPKTRTLPAVLMPEQVWRLIDATRLFHFQVFFRTSYTCGLRPGDTRHLTLDDVDGDRMLLQVRTTKGRNDRCVPLPRKTLEALREYWLTHRNPKWLFPARADLKNVATATKPISERSVQRAFAQVAQSVGLKKKGVCPHTLRKVYSYYGSSLRMRYLKGNSACLGSRVGGWRPLRTVATSDLTEVRVSDSRAMIQGVDSATCVAASVPSRIRRRITV